MEATFWLTFRCRNNKFTKLSIIQLVIGRFQFCFNQNKVPLIDFPMPEKPNVQLQPLALCSVRHLTHAQALIKLWKSMWLSTAKCFHTFSYQKYKQAAFGATVACLLLPYIGYLGPFTHQQKDLKWLLLYWRVP